MIAAANTSLQNGFGYQTTYNGCPTHSTDNIATKLEEGEPFVFLKYFTKFLKVKCFRTFYKEFYG